MITNGITIFFNNYRCFKERTSFGPIKRANVIIGRNNSGKSALIDVFTLFCSSASASNTDDYGFELERGLTEMERDHILGKGSPKVRYHMQRNQLYLDQIAFRFKRRQNRYDLLFCNDELITNVLVGKIKQEHDFSKLVVYRLNAERDIVPEPSAPDVWTWNVPTKGADITKMIQAILHRSDLKQEIVEHTILKAFNQIVMPDVNAERILAKQEKNQDWQIYFAEEGKGLIPLSQSGSGLKTVLAVLVFIHALPKLQDIDYNRIVFAFEELENNLHPFVQRKLYDYIEEQSKNLKFSYFISTHSTVALDYYYRIPDASIFQVNRTDKGSSVSLISNNMDVSNPIDELGQKASDLLQSNCIIWVEGPSDRLYLNKWIELYSRGAISENKHYSIMFYGGRLLSHLSFDSNMSEHDTASLISMFKINRHSIVIIDSDKRSAKTKLNDTKSRIRKELEKDGSLCWITQGREIENYLSQRVLQAFVKPDPDEAFKNKYCSLISEIPKVTKNPELKKKELNKVAFAKRIAQDLNEADLNTLDLKKMLEKVVSKLKEWNKQ